MAHSADAVKHSAAFVLAYDWLEVLSFLATTLGVVFLAIGSGFAYFQLREAAVVRRAQLYANIRDRWKAKDLTRARDLVQRLIAQGAPADMPDEWARYGRDVQDGLVLRRALLALKAAKASDFTEAIRIPSFLEDLGVLCRRGIALPDDVFDLMGSSIETQITRFLPYMIGQREDGSSVYANVLWLYGAVRRRRPYTETDARWSTRGSDGTELTIRAIVEAPDESDRIVTGGVERHRQ